jgi:hypothetical protein
MGGSRTAIVSAACAALLVAACARGAAPSPTPITSAGDPAAPVPFRWELAAGTLRLQGGTLHAIADEVRVRDAGGQAVASAPAVPLGASATGLCGEPRAQGMVRAEVRLPDPGRWPGQLRLEARVGGTWRPAQLTQAC